MKDFDFSIDDGMKVEYIGNISYDENNVKRIYSIEEVNKKKALYIKDGEDNGYLALGFYYDDIYLLDGFIILKGDFEYKVNSMNKLYDPINDKMIITARNFSIDDNSDDKIIYAHRGNEMWAYTYLNDKEYKGIHFLFGCPADSVEFLCKSYHCKEKNHYYFKTIHNDEMMLVRSTPPQEFKGAFIVTRNGYTDIKYNEDDHTIYIYGDRKKEYNVDREEEKIYKRKIK